MTPTPSADQLRRAIEISEQIAELESQLAAILNGSAPTQDAGKTRHRRRRKMSSEARERIAAAQRVRWAKAKGKSAVKNKSFAKATKVQTKKRRNGITPEDRAKLAAMMKARWAARKRGAATSGVK